MRSAKRNLPPPSANNQESSPSPSTCPAIQARLSQISSRHPEVQVSLLYGGDTWLIQAVALVLILREDSFMHTFHNAPPVRDHQCSMASRPRRARPRPFPSSSCAALTCHALWRRNPPGGDAVAGPADG